MHDDCRDEVDGEDADGDALQEGALHFASRCIFRTSSIRPNVSPEIASLLLVSDFMDSMTVEAVATSVFSGSDVNDSPNSPSIEAEVAKASIVSSAFLR